MILLVAACRIERRIGPRDLATVKNKVREEFADCIRDIEREKLISLLDVYQLNVGSISRVIMNCAGAPVESAIVKMIPDGYGSSVYGAFGLIIGGIWAATQYDKMTNSYYLKDNATYTIHSSRTMLEAILGRALKLTLDLRRRGFANQTEPDLTLTKEHVPSDAKELLAQLFDSADSRLTQSAQRQAGYKLEANILRWIEQEPE